MRSKKMLWLLVAVALVPLASPQCLTPADSAAAAENPSDLQLYQGQKNFTLSMLKSLNTQDSRSNLFFSPLSVYSTLLLAYFISSNQTEKSLLQTLHLPAHMSKVNVLKAYNTERLLENARALETSDSYQLINANRLFTATSLSVRPCMLQLFHNEIEQVDFQRDVDAATNHINKWVSDLTKGQIKDLIAKGWLSPSAKLVLANAAYFKGLWKSQFHANTTKKEVFFIDSTRKAQVMMMRQKDTFNHFASDELGAHVLQLPYKGSTVSMFVFLPPYASQGGISMILSRLNPKNLQEILSEDAMIPRKVEVGLPRFSVEQTLELTPILNKMGVGDLFNTSADLSALTGGSEIQLDTAIHKAKIQVDEEGTTAAAATAVLSFRSSRPLDTAKFICNHPFMYMLYDSSSQAILFAGIYQSPPPLE